MRRTRTRWTDGERRRAERLQDADKLVSAMVMKGRSVEAIGAKLRRLNRPKRKPPRQLELPDPTKG